ncbi:MAG: hypothetical protein ABR511_01335, partial [Acidimicrobiales bacterium]
RLEVTDRIEGSGRHRIVSTWHLAPGTIVRDLGDARVEVGAAELRVEGADTVEVEVSMVATGFDRLEPNHVVTASLTADSPAVLRTTLDLGPAEGGHDDG